MNLFYIHFLKFLLLCTDLIMGVLCKMPWRTSSSKVGCTTGMILHSLECFSLLQPLFVLNRWWCYLVEYFCEVDLHLFPGFNRSWDYPGVVYFACSKYFCRIFFASVHDCIINSLYSSIIFLVTVCTNENWWRKQ